MQGSPITYVICLSSLVVSRWTSITVIEGGPPPVPPPQTSRVGVHGTRGTDLGNTLRSALCSPLWFSPGPLSPAVPGRTWTGRTVVSSPGDLEDPVRSALGVDHAERDEGVVPGLGRDQLDEPALRGSQS